MLTDVDCVCYHYGDSLRRLKIHTVSQFISLCSCLGSGYALRVKLAEIPQFSVLVVVGEFASATPPATLDIQFR